MDLLFICVLCLGVPFVLQLLICRKTRRKWLRLPVLVLPLLWLVLAVVSYFGNPGEAIGSGEAVSQMYLVFALCSVVGYGVAFMCNAVLQLRDGY